MHLTDDKHTIRIYFESKDWKNGLARAMIDAIKSFPYAHRKYLSDLKIWAVVSDRVYRDKIMAIRDRYLNPVSEYDDFDVDKWWKEVEAKNDENNTAGTEL